MLDGRAIDGVEEAGADLSLGAELRVSGSGGCNRYFGSYSLDGGSIRFGPLASTLMYCEGTMVVEQAFFKALDLVRGICADGDALCLSSEDGTTVLAFRTWTDP